MFLQGWSVRSVRISSVIEKNICWICKKMNISAIFKIYGDVVYTCYIFIYFHRLCKTILSNQEHKQPILVLTSQLSAETVLPLSFHLVFVGFFYFVFGSKVGGILIIGLVGGNLKKKNLIVKPTIGTLFRTHSVPVSDLVLH